MGIKKNIFIFLLLYCITLSAKNYVDKSLIDSTDLEFKFNQAVSYFNENKLSDALTVFENIIFTNKYNSYTNPSTIFISKILTKQKKFNEAEKILLDFINNNKTSNYIDEAKIQLANIYFLQTNYQLAVENLISILENSSPVGIDSQNEKNNDFTERFCENILLNHFSSEKINELIQKYDSKEIKSFLLLALSKLQFNKGLYTEAENSLEKILSDYNNTKYYKDALQFQKLIDEKEFINKISNIILVLLPLTDNKGNSSQTAIDVLNGIKYSINDYNESSGISKNEVNKIALLIKDTKKDKEQIQKIYDEIKDIKNIKLIIGPLFSDETKFVCDIFDDLNIPIISPTATADDLTLKYKNFYQANPSYIIRGKLMAQYVYFVENKRQMAVLYSNEGYSSILANSFTNEFQKLGGKILNSQSYSIKKNDIQIGIKNIKNNIKIIEGIYLPISDNQYSNMILSTLILNNININLYGNQDWLSSYNLEKYSDLSKKLVFTSDYYLDYTNNNLLSFSTEVKNKTNSEINRNFMYGYDITKFITHLLADNKTNNSLTKSILKNEFRKGFHNFIHFGEDRINQYLNIIRFNDGKFELIDRFKYNSNGS
ncbi:MAG: hypothetical protein STSR0008_21750 [Ignavibacterium sp.]